MVKRFKKGKCYTLCLVRLIADEPFSFCRNVTYSCRVGNRIYFSGIESSYEVNGTMCIIHDIVDNSRTICHVSNIVADWQY